MNDDASLLRAYADQKSEAAFAELVRRHIDLVYGAALRRTGGDAHAAADEGRQDDGNQVSQPTLVHRLLGDGRRSGQERARSCSNSGREKKEEIDRGGAGVGARSLNRTPGLTG